MVNRKVTSNSIDGELLPVSKITEPGIRILLVDDSNMIRQTLEHQLKSQADLIIVGSFNHAQAAIEQIETLDPDLVLMDIEMPGMDGIQATQALVSKMPQIKVITFSSHDDQEYIEQILNAGAKGYLLKTTPLEELTNCIRFAHKGYFQFSPGVLQKVDSNAIAPCKSSVVEQQEIVPLKPIETQSLDWSSQTKELIDTLPRVWTRGLFYFLALFTAIALPWTILAEVDQTGTARGRLEPSGNTFILDAPVAGTVAAINFQPGDTVTAGQSLLELESDIVHGELQQLQTQLVGQDNRLNQLELLKKQLLLTVDTQEQESQGQKLEKQAQIAQARQQVQFFQTSYSSQAEEKLAQVNQAEQNVVYSQTALNSAREALSKAQQEIKRYRNALQQGIISEVQVIEQENIIAERQQSFDQAVSEFQQAELRLAEQQNSYAQVVRQAKSDIEQAQLQLEEQEKGDRTLAHTGKLAVLRSQEQLKNIESEIATLTAEIAQSKSQIASGEYQLKQHVIKAPVTGTIFELPIQKSGKVVQPGDAIAEIAPKGSSLVVRAEMATAESGSLIEGMPVKLKFDAYPFQDYGIATGKLTAISPTSKLTDTEQGQVANYNLEVELERDCLPTRNQCIALRPGDTVTAEVIVRQRRIIDLILDPFKKLQEGGLDL